jgi:hypothetical protein
MSEIKTDKLTGTSTAKTVTVTVGATATQSLEQGLLKTRAVYNQHASSTYNGVTAGSGGSDTLNVSSYDDDSTGNAGVNLTNNMSSIQYSFFGNMVQTNNTCCIGTDTSTSAIEVVMADADSSAAQDNLWYCANAGDLA